MSSRKAIYESSMLLPFGADDEFADSGLTGGVADRVGAAVVGSEGFAFAFGAAISLLTRTDAGT